MTTASNSNRKQSSEITQVVKAFKEQGFRKADAYRYNTVSIRVRVIDRKFAGKSRTERIKLAEQAIRTLPEAIQADILFLALLTPTEAKQSTMNDEFENPSPPLLPSSRPDGVR